MPACCAFGCSNRSGLQKSSKQKDFEKDSKITFHRFPKNPDRRQAWIKAARRVGWTPSGSSVLCSNHFSEDCFDRTSLSCVRLRETAIPTIFKSFPSYLQQKPKVSRQPPRRRQLEVSGITATTTGSKSMNIDDGALGGPSTSSTELPSLPFIPVQQEEQNRIRTLTSRTTSFSPLRRMTRAMSPTKALLLNKMRLKEMEYRRKLRQLQQTKRRYGKKIATMSAVLRSLKTEKYLQEDQLLVLKNIPGPNSEILKRQLAKSSESKIPRQYNEELRKFAVTLHYYSPSAYNYVRNAFNSCLPHPKTISKWYSSVNGAPGFTTEAFRAIKFRCEFSDRPLLCSLCIDEMAIRRKIEFDGKKYHGYVEYGTNNNDDTVAEAKDALVFMVVSINDSWKLPVAYFLVDGVSAEQRCSLLNICLSKCHDAGIRVISVTFDGAASNMSMMSRLGCDFKSHVTWFNHPDTKEKIYFYPDPCHMLKNVRNTFGDKKILYDVNNRTINWKFVIQLQQLQDNEKLHLANKLKSIHVQFRKQVMKVRLAAQLLSESVACALEFCAYSLQLSEFEDCSGTVDFIRMFNNLFDIFNTKNFRQYGFKIPICNKNFEHIFKVLDESENYIMNLKCSDNTSIISSNRKTGFIGFLICINSLKNMYKDFVENESLLKYIPTYKFNQDHLEILFSVIRAQGGYNNNPTSRQFAAAYRKILIHMELQTSSTGNCIPLENINILHVSSSINKTNAVDVINKSTDLPFTEDECIPVLDDSDHTYLKNVQELSEYTENIISYISGFVVRFLKKVLHCEECINSLEEDFIDGRNNYLNFINIKNKGGLVYPSTDVINICRTTEKVIKQVLAESGGVHIKKKFSVLLLVTSVLKYYSNRNIFSNLLDHINNQNPFENHIVHLIRAIAEKYINIRFHYIAKSNTDEAKSRRQHYNKLTLFQGY